MDLATRGRLGRATSPGRRCAPSWRPLRCDSRTSSTPRSYWAWRPGHGGCERRERGGGHLGEVEIDLPRALLGAGTGTGRRGLLGSHDLQGDSGLLRGRTARRTSLVNARHTRSAPGIHISERRHARSEQRVSRPTGSPRKSTRARTRPQARWRPARCADHPGARSRTRVRDLERAARRQPARSECDPEMTKDHGSGPPTGSPIRTWTSMTPPRSWRRPSCSPPVPPENHENLDRACTRQAPEAEGTHR